ncbi:MAG: hypothetical protein HQ556_00540 [Candidatus Marinimicrobia bacterium]|nr:hypothetical protein [Candidatus Neomarinimicrobiota bacterium]
MRYNSIPQPVSSLFRGPRGRTRAVLSSVSHGVAGLLATVPAPKEKTRPVRPAAPVIHYEIAANSRMAG